MWNIKGKSLAAPYCSYIDECCNRMKDGKLLPHGGRFSFEELDDGTVVLLIDKVTAADAGLYSILAMNEDGEARSEAPVTSEYLCFAALKHHQNVLTLFRMISCI